MRTWGEARGCSEFSMIGSCWWLLSRAVTYLILHMVTRELQIARQTGGVTTQEAIEDLGWRGKGRFGGRHKGSLCWWQHHRYHHRQVGKERRQMALGSKGRCGWAPLGRTREGLQGGVLRTMCSESQSLKLGWAPGALLAQSLIL